MRFWFNWSCPWIWLPPLWLQHRLRRHKRASRTRAHFKLWNFFIRSGLCWGVGILQVRRRHLLALINNGDNEQTVIWVGFHSFRKDRLAAAIRHESEAKG